MTLKACKGGPSHTYVKINGAVKRLTGEETTLEQLDLGLYCLEVYTGASSKVDFKGFVLE